MYFLGKADVVKIRGNPHFSKTNSGYDDERGDYLVTPRDHIAYRYAGRVGGSAAAGVFELSDGGRRRGQG